MSRLELALDQLKFVRKYTTEFLDEIPASDWFRQPAGGISHIAWQVGHLTFARYRMALWRTRGEQPGDEQLFPKEYIQLFGYGSVPVFDSTKYPNAPQIRAVFDGVHEQSLQELSKLNEQDLEQPVLHPHPFAQNKFQALMWCANHEMLHAGQIGLLRRELGYAPL